MKITFLGTSDAVPSAERNHTAIFLNYEGENILVDCGEGTQRQFRKAELNPCKITRILLTHWHADHVLGLSGLLKTLDLTGYTKTLFIYGPKGIRRHFQNLLMTFGKIENYKINVEEVSGKFFENKNFYLEAIEMTHGIKCNAYSFVKKGQIKIDKKKLLKFKISSSKELQKLKEGKSIVHNGKKYSPKQLIYSEKDVKISFILDSSFNKNAVKIAKDSDLLICESTYSDELKEMAKERGHLTSRQAAEIAKKSRSKKLILTHIGQRYLMKQDEILKEAKNVFRNTILVRDLDVVEI